MQGPTLPSRANHILAREAAEEQAAAERGYQQKRDKAEARERIEDMVGPREVGCERMLEKKRERREGDRAFRDRGDEGLEVDKGMLMGVGIASKPSEYFVSSPTSCAYPVVDMQFCETELPAEMQRVQNRTLHAKTEHSLHRSAPQPFAKRTRHRSELNKMLVLISASLKGACLFGSG